MSSQQTTNFGKKQQLKYHVRQHSMTNNSKNSYNKSNGGNQHSSRKPKFIIPKVQNNSVMPLNFQDANVHDYIHCFDQNLNPQALNDSSLKNQSLSSSNNNNTKSLKVTQLSMSDQTSQPNSFQHSRQNSNSNILQFNQTLREQDSNVQFKQGSVQGSKANSPSKNIREQQQKIREIQFNQKSSELMNQKYMFNQGLEMADEYAPFNKENSNSLADIREKMRNVSAYNESNEIVVTDQDQQNSIRKDKHVNYNNSAYLSQQMQRLNNSNNTQALREYDEFTNNNEVEEYNCLSENTSYNQRKLEELDFKKRQQTGFIDSFAGLNDNLDANQSQEFLINNQLEIDLQNLDQDEYQPLIIPQIVQQDEQDGLQTYDLMSDPQNFKTFTKINNQRVSQGSLNRQIYGSLQQNPTVSTIDKSRDNLDSNNMSSNQILSFDLMGQNTNSYEAKKQDLFQIFSGQNSDSFIDQDESTKPNSGYQSQTKLRTRENSQNNSIINFQNLKIYDYNKKGEIIANPYAENKMVKNLLTSQQIQLQKDLKNKPKSRHQRHLSMTNAPKDSTSIFQKSNLQEKQDSNKFQNQNSDQRFLINTRQTAFLSPQNCNSNNNSTLSRIREGEELLLSNQYDQINQLTQNIAQRQRRSSQQEQQHQQPSKMDSCYEDLQNNENHDISNSNYNVSQSLAQLKRDNNISTNSQFKRQSIDASCISPDNLMKIQTLEIHKLRQSNAKLRDNQSRSQKRMKDLEQKYNEIKRDQRLQDFVKHKDYQYIIKADKQIETYQECYQKVIDKFKVNKKELKECKQKLESRDALIQATKLALEHVLETAKLEVIDSQNSLTLQTLMNISNQLSQL
eukprot:403376101